MAAPLNGTSGPSAPDPISDVAQAVWTQGATEDDPAWSDLTDDQRDDLCGYARDHLQAHIDWMTQHGFRIVPPGAVATPRSDDEALAMVKAAKGWFDAQKRKGKLIGEGPRPKLILPGTAH